MDTNANDGNEKIVYWHRELPPLKAQPRGEHTVEATSDRVAGRFSHRDEIWETCKDRLMAQARTRLEQEVARLGGQYAHVLSEAIDVKHDDATGEAWLHGVFTYMLFGRAESGGGTGAGRPAGTRST
jgi:hypothetical protein